MPAAKLHEAYRGRQSARRSCNGSRLVQGGDAAHHLVLVVQHHQAAGGQRGLRGAQHRHEALLQQRLVPRLRAHQSGDTTPHTGYAFITCIKEQSQAALSEHSVVRYALRGDRLRPQGREAAADHAVLLPHLSADQPAFCRPCNTLGTCSEASFTSGCDFWPDGHELVSTTTQRRLPRALAVTNTSAPAHLKWCSSCRAATNQALDCLQALCTVSRAPSATAYSPVSQKQ